MNGHVPRPARRRRPPSPVLRPARRRRLSSLSFLLETTAPPPTYFSNIMQALNQSRTRSANFSGVPRKPEKIVKNAQKPVPRKGFWHFSFLTDSSGMI